MRRNLIKFLTLAFFLTLTSKVQAAGLDESKIYYFYGQGCSHCAKVDKFLKENDLYKKYPIKKLEVYNNPGNAAIFNNVFDSQETPLSERGVPAIWFPQDKILVGDIPIIKDFESYANNFTGEIQDGEIAIVETVNKPNLTILAVLTGALVDSINPCAFAVLIILLTTILATGKREKALKAGLLFATSIFLSYLAMGLGLYKALTIGNLPQYFTTVIGILAIILGIFNLKDYFNYGGLGFVMEVPMSWRPKMKAILAGITTPVGAFFVGFVISLFLLPCTSGPYIVVLGMLSQKEMLLQAVIYLIIYNLVFVAPMILITLGVYKGLDIKKAEETRKDKIKLLHLIAGILLIGMGALVLLGIF
jgi:cytochrome c biogenesis protein CcdA